jgi:nicotinate-nucleotide pyrophosphorylase (carboxylating)
MAGGVGTAVRAAHEAAPDLPLEVECRSAAEVDEALAAGARRLLLDNMDPAQLREIVARVGGAAELEASGGVRLETVREIAATGVQWVSVGALTHSAATLDLSLILERQP